MDYPGPQELIDYLKQPGRKKAKGQFAKSGGRCCLGHYADMCGLVYLAEVVEFNDDAGLAGLPRVDLPDDHWILEHQSDLAKLNDNTTGFLSVIAQLEGIAAEVAA